MSRYDFDDDQPYVVIERHSSENGVGAFLKALREGKLPKLCHLLLFPYRMCLILSL